MDGDGVASGQDVTGRSTRVAPVSLDGVLEKATGITMLVISLIGGVRVLQPGLVDRKHPEAVLGGDLPLDRD